MNPKEIIDYVESPAFTQSVLGLSNTTLLLEKAGRPDEKFPIIHIAGTNGKGSTAAMTASVLKTMGKKVGLYTSPYLTSYLEKIRINGEFVSSDTFVKMGEKLIEISKEMANDGGVHPTSFEMSTVLALMCFEEEACDVVVLEVGLGGRLDATNAVKAPKASVITSIGMDHTEVLGDTLEKITAEKCGILKTGVHAVLSPKNPENVKEVVKTMAKNVKASLEIPSEPTHIEISPSGTTFQFEGASYKTPLIGEHQAYNAVTAICALRACGFTPDEATVKKGLLSTSWEGRLEAFEGKIIIDGAHNPEGAKTLAKSIAQLSPNQQVMLLLGMLSDKDFEACYEMLRPFAERVVLTKVPSPRTALLSDWVKVTGDDPFVSFVEDYKEALLKAKELQKDGQYLVICGSLYLIGALRPLLSNGS